MYAREPQKRISNLELGFLVVLSHPVVAENLGPLKEQLEFYPLRRRLSSPAFIVFSCVYVRGGYV